MARFVDELEVTKDASHVSTVTLASDMQGLRKGIDLILYEREKQQNNFIIHTFYLNAVPKGGGGGWRSRKFRILDNQRPPCPQWPGLPTATN